MLDTLFFKGFRAVESITPDEYTVSKILVDDTRKLNKKLDRILTLNSEASLDCINEAIIKAFDVSEGEVETRIKTSAVSYDGQLSYFDVSGTIQLVSIDADLSLLHEDLICAFYKTRGGQFGLFRDFLNFIRNDIKVSPHSKFIVI